MTEIIIPESEVFFEDDTVIKYSASLSQGIREAVYYTSLNHPHIIKSESVQFIKKNKRYFVEIIFKRYLPISEINFTKSLASKLFKEIADALAYLEANNILQSDIKPDNIYYDQDLEIFVLADFDLAYYTKECFINRTASPSTRPPEVAIADIDLERLQFSSRSFFHVRLSHRDALSHWQGDIFSLAMTISILLTNELWYPYELNEQVDEVSYKSKLNDVLEKLSDWDDINVLKRCLDFDYRKRPTPSELASELGSLKVYSKCQMISQDTNKLYDIIYEDISNYEKYHKPNAILRKKKASSMFVSYFSILGRLPEDILEYALTMSSTLWLSALLCFEDELYYPEDVLEYFFVGENYWAHEESEEPETYFKLLGAYDGTPEEFRNNFEKMRIQNTLNVCEVLNFHLLF